MRGCSGNDTAAFPVALRAQEMLRPLVDGKHFELDRHPERPLEHFRHFAIAGCGRMQGPVAHAVLENDEWKYGSLSDVVVAALSHRNVLIQFGAMEKRLPQLSNVAFALQLDAKLLSNGTGASVASDQMRSSNGFVGALTRPDARCYGIAILREGRQFTAESHCDVRQRLDNRSKQRFECVLRD